MIIVALIGAVTAVAVFAILMKVFAGEPPGADKLQKADIIKQLLALSELENPPAKNPVRVQAQAPRQRPSAQANTAKPPGRNSNSGASKPTAAKPAEQKGSTVTALVKVSPSAPAK